jgi:hypothetical protein
LYLGDSHFSILSRLKCDPYSHGAERQAEMITAVNGFATTHGRFIFPDEAFVVATNSSQLREDLRIGIRQRRAKKLDLDVSWLDAWGKVDPDDMIDTYMAIKHVPTIASRLQLQQRLQFMHMLKHLSPWEFRINLSSSNKIVLHSHG